MSRLSGLLRRLLSGLSRLSGLRRLPRLRRLPLLVLGQPLLLSGRSLLGRHLQLRPSSRAVRATLRCKLSLRYRFTRVVTVVFGLNRALLFHRVRVAVARILPLIVRTSPISAACIPRFPPWISRT